MDYSVCIDAVFEDQSRVEAMALAARLGFKAIEMWGVTEEEAPSIAEAATRLGLVVAAFCTKKVPLNDAERLDDYLSGLRSAIRISKVLRCPRIITQVGDERIGVPRSEQMDTVLSGLRSCRPLLKEAGAILLVEPLNIIVDHHGYLLSRSDEAFELIAQVDSENVRLLYDIYHQATSGEDVTCDLERHFDWIGHFHVAGVPGRGRPDQGELDYVSILEIIHSRGYAGFIGLEFFPTGDPEIELLAALSLVDGRWNP
jgi:hydroxypyruvate isomerase